MAEILLGVTGGIAAYKACELVRLFQKAGHGVTVAMTDAATKFVTPVTFRALTGRTVFHDLFSSEGGGDIDHIAVARRHDLFVVAPATADSLARLRHGLANDLLTTLALAWDGPLVLAPAMNPHMWAHPAVRENAEALAARGALLVGPAEGEAACGEHGVGRMAEPAEICAAALARLTRADLKGVRVVVTAGGTREPLDPVRFLGNRSSGRMGVALADEARRRGAAVTLIHGALETLLPAGVVAVAAPSAAAMAEAVRRHARSADVLVMAAAVADFRPVAAALGKLKKGAGVPEVKLEPTEDILGALARKRPARLKVVGFAAETGDPEKEGRRKLKEKNLDALFANDVSRPDTGMESSRNGGVLLLKGGKRVAFAVQDKTALARGLWDALCGAGIAATKRRG